MAVGKSRQDFQTWNITLMVKGREKRKRVHPLACSLVLSLALHSSSSLGLCQVPLMVDEATSINVIKTIPTDVPTGQLNVDSPSVRFFPGDSRLCRVDRANSNNIYVNNAPEICPHPNTQNL